MNSILTAESEKSLKRLNRRVKRLKSFNRLMVFLEAFLLTVVFLIGALAAGIAVQLTFSPPRWSSIIFFVLELVAFFLLIKYFVLSLLRKRVGNEEDFALQIENRLTALQDRVASAIGLGNVLRNMPENAPVGSVRCDPRTFSLSMLNALFVDAKKTASKHFLAKVLIRFRAMFLLSIVFGAMILSTQTTRWTPFTFNDMMNMYLDPLLKSPFTRRSRFVVEPGDIELYPGEDFSVKVTLFEEAQREPIVAFRTGGSDWDRVSMNSSGSQVGAKEYFYNIAGVMKPLEYYVSYEGDDSAKYTVTVVRRPRLSSIKVVYQLPEYLNSEISIGETGEGNIYAPWNTKTQIGLQYDMELKSAKLDFFPADVEIEEEDAELEDTEEQYPAELLTGPPDSTYTLSHPDEDWTTTLVVEQSGYYRLSATEKQFGKFSEPIVYRVAIQQNSVPEVIMHEPSRDISGLQIAQLPIFYQIQDDFGVSKVDLVYAVKGEGKAMRIPLGEYPNDKKIRGQYNWDISKLKKAKQPVSFAIEAFDLTPPKEQRPPGWERPPSGLSEVRNILWKQLEEKIPEEEFEEAPEQLTLRTIEEDAELIIRTMDQAEQALDDIVQQVENIENSNLTEEQKKKELKELAEEHQEINKVIRKAKQQAERLQRKTAQAEGSGGGEGTDGQPSNGIQSATGTGAAASDSVGSATDSARGANGDIEEATGNISSATNGTSAAESTVASATGYRRSKQEQVAQEQSSDEISDEQNQQFQKALQDVADELGEKVKKITEEEISVKPGIGKKMQEASEEMEKGNTQKANSQNQQIKQQLRNMQQRLAEAVGLEEELEQIREENEREARKRLSKKDSPGSRKGGQEGTGKKMGSTTSAPGDSESSEDVARYDLGSYKMELKGARSVIEKNNDTKKGKGLQALEEEKVPQEYENVVRKYFELLSDDS